MLGLSLATRITMIVVIALTMVWIGAIALFYRTQAPANDSPRPAPARIAALVALIESMPQARRPLVLAAVDSSSFEARLEAATATPEAAEGEPADEAVRAAYAAVLGGRPLSVAHSSRLAGDPLFPRLYRAVSNALEFRIGLSSGDTLVINTWALPTISRLGVPVGFGAGLFGTVVALIALIIMHRETRPLARLAAAADRMDLSGPVPLPRARTSAPEIRALIAAFDRLQTRLGQLLRARMAMLGGISHDVRSFATRLRLRVEQIPDAGERERAIGDIADMIRLLDDAMLASRAGVGELAEELVEFDAVIRTEAEDRRAAGAPVTLRTAPDAEGLAVLGDRLALRRIVANLVDNAVAYGHAAHLGLSREAEMVRLDVDDEGPGISPEGREVLLEPFVRLETSRNRRTGGAGLGLAVVRSLVDAHGGEIEIGQAPTGGARFTVRLPLFRAA